jgi:SAM-dependent methyltransferase
MAPQDTSESASRLERYGIDPKTLAVARHVYAGARRTLDHSQVTFRDCPICQRQGSRPAVADFGKDVRASLITATGFGLKLLAGMPLVYHYCEPCDYFFVSPIPALRFVDLDHAEIDSRRPRENRWMLDEAYVADKKASIARHIEAAGFEAIDRDAPIVDIGCGIGVGLEVFHERGFRNLYGIEPDLFSVTVMKRERPWIHAVHADAYSPPADFAARFALVMFDNVLEHQTRPVQAAAAAFAMLRPGGVLWATVPNASGPDFRTNKMKSQNLNFGHWSYFTPRALTKLLGLFCAEVKFYGPMAEDWINVTAKKMG